MAQLSDAAMLARSQTCSNQRAFVTLVSGEEYARPACCLRRQLLHAGSTCPMHVVIDDRNGSGTRVGLQTTLRACGFNRTYSLTSLISSVRSTSAPPHNSRLLQSPQPQLHGRRLLHGGPAGVAATSAKLWLWALPLELVAFLDVDVFVAKDIDEERRKRRSEGKFDSISEEIAALNAGIISEPSTVGAVDERVECKFCARKFAPERLEKHMVICKETKKNAAYRSAVKK